MSEFETYSTRLKKFGLPEIVLNNILFAYTKGVKTAQDVLDVLKEHMDISIDVNNLKDILEFMPKYEFKVLLSENDCDPMAEESKENVLKFLSFVDLFVRYGINCKRAVTHEEHVRKCFEYKLLDRLPKEYPFLQNSFKEVFDKPVKPVIPNGENLLRMFVRNLGLTYEEYLSSLSIDCDPNKFLLYKVHYGDSHPYCGKCLIFLKDLKSKEFKSVNNLSTCKYIPFLVCEGSLTTIRSNLKKGVLVYYNNLVLPVMENTFDTHYWYTVFNRIKPSTPNYLAELGFTRLADYENSAGTKNVKHSVRDSIDNDCNELLYIVNALTDFEPEYKHQTKFTLELLNASDKVVKHQYACINRFVDDNVTPYIAKYFGYLHVRTSGKIIMEPIWVYSIAPFSYNSNT